MSRHKRQRGKDKNLPLPDAKECPFVQTGLKAKHLPN